MCAHEVNKNCMRVVDEKQVRNLIVMHEHNTVT